MKPYTASQMYNTSLSQISYIFFYKYKTFLISGPKSQNLGNGINSICKERSAAKFAGLERKAKAYNKQSQRHSGWKHS